MKKLPSKFKKEFVKEKKMFTSEDVKKVNFSKKNGKDILIGRGFVGNVLVGRVIFKNNTVKRVAIKRFNFPFSDTFAVNYKKVITDLQSIKLRSGKPLIPKMDLVKIKTKENPDGEWVQITQLFGSTKKGSKFKTNFEGFNFSKETIDEVAEIISKLNQKGYTSGDLFATFKKKEGVIVLDLDEFARSVGYFKKPTPYDILPAIKGVVYRYGPEHENTLMRDIYNACQKYFKKETWDKIERYRQKTYISEYKW